MRWWRKWRELGIKEQLLFTNIAIVTIPLIMMGFQYFEASKSMVTNVARNQLHDTLVKNNEIMDAKLEQIKDYALGFSIDKDLETLLSKSYDAGDEYELFMLDKQINNIMNKYFLHSPDIFSVYLVTQPYIFGNSSARGYLPKQVFHETNLYRQAVEADGMLTWAPTYSFADVFHQEQMANFKFDYSRMFSALKLLYNVNFNFSNGDALGTKTRENPTLLINFNDDFFNKFYQDSAPEKHMYTFIVSKSGRIITHQDKEKVGKQADFPWLADIASQGTGIDTVTIDGQRMIIAYDTSKTTDWISVAAVSESFFVTDIVRVIRANVVTVVFVLLLLSIVISAFVSVTITRPIRSLNTAISQVGTGNFDLVVPEKGSLEIRKLIYKFNSMNSNIQNLIEENYKSAILKNEAEIKALNLQLDPHFMYNTLNIINLKLIKSNQDETSEIIMSLSTMLKYSLGSGNDLVMLEKDLSYTRSYIHIMQTRFEGKFHVEYHIDPRLYEFNVPKFFIQPLVENALIHGFKGMERNGELRIAGWMDEHYRYFCVEDNGIGISPERLRELSDPNSGSIGIANVRDRIRMVYGKPFDLNIESEVGKGTKITVQMPR